MYRLAAAAAIAVFSIHFPTALAAAEAFRAQGNEPFWSLRMTGEAITFSTMDGKALTVAPVPGPTKEGGAETYKGKVDGKDFVLVLASKLCTDTMSGMPFPISVTVEHDTNTFTGCGGEPAALLHGAWRIADIDGKPIIDKTEPTIDFTADGKVSGNGSCNRFFGGYTLSGEGLTIGQLGSSMMMCEDAVMAQERMLLEILKNTIGFAIGTDGALSIKTVDGRTITARR